MVTADVQQQRRSLNARVADPPGVTASLSISPGVSLARHLHRAGGERDCIPCCPFKEPFGKEDSRFKKILDLLSCHMYQVQ